MKRGKYYILITLFFTGAAIMVLELLGARIIGPFYGVSLYVWSSLITITLIALAIGYFLGGHMADKRPQISMLYLFILLAGLYLLLIPTISAPILKASNALGIRGGTLLSAFILFTIPLILLGTVIPYTIKLLTSELKTLGTTAGNLYAISTVGSCAGTILTGFVLIPNIGVTRILYLLAFLLILLWAIWMVFSKKFAKSLLALPLLIVCVTAALATPKPFEKGDLKIVYKAESLYGQVKVLDIGNQRWLLIDGTCHTVIDKEKKESLLEYCYYFELPFFFNPKGKDLLLVGMGGGGMVQAFEEYGLNLDMVEIDPKVTYATKEYFGVSEEIGNIYMQDGRYYITHTPKKYDFIILDAFSAAGHPFHLFTKEAFQEIKKILKEDGILGVNTLSFFEGQGSTVWKSVYKTLREVFPYVKIYPVRRSGLKGGTLTLLASRRKMELKRNIHLESRNEVSKRFLLKMLENEIESPPEEGIILTDGYNPIELWDIGMAEDTRRVLFKTFDPEVLLD